jgi:hypothetical protein
MALLGCFRKGVCLLDRLPFLARKRHPFANNRPSRARFGHVALLFENAAAGPSVTGLDVPPPPPFLRAIDYYAAFLSGVVCWSRAASAQPHS